MTSKEKQNENLYEWISGILGHISNGYPLQRSDECAKNSIILDLCLFLNVLSREKINKFDNRSILKFRRELRFGESFILFRPSEFYSATQ
jgi:hypothetical protein